LPCWNANAQWLEAGPFTSTSTAASSPTSLNSNDLVVGMASQGNPVYGAANAILQSPSDPNTYWVATASGGIWKTTNGGVTWTPTTDHQASLAIGAMTLDTADPSGKTLYAATGDFSAGLYHFSPQTTILKSTDGGNSWNALSSTGIQNLYLSFSGQQLVDPTPASIKNIIAMGNVILVGAGASTGTNSFFNSGGLYRSTDGGATFALVPGFGTEISSLIATSINNQTVLVAARNGDFDLNASAVLYSVDSGATWTTLLGPGTSLQSTNSSNPDHVSFNGGHNDLNIKVAAGPGGSLFVAVVKDASGSEPIGLFYTPQFSPGSATPPVWYNLGEPQFITASGSCVAAHPCPLEGNLQGALHFALVADPTQKGVAYIAGSGLFDLTLPGLARQNEVATIVRVNYNSTTNAASYTPIAFPGNNSSPHPDTRSLVFDTNGNLLTTDDGGVYTLTNPATSGTWTALGGSAAAGSPLRAIETYSAVMDPKTGRLAFASQDNGAGLSAPTAAISQIMPGAPWQNVLGGDGFSVAVNPKTASGPSIFYATADDPRLARTFASENLSPASPPNLLNINVAGTGGQGFFAYQADNANGIVVAVNAVDPTKLLFRSSRLYTWTDPGTALSGNINVTDISTGNIFDPTAWAEKIAYGTQGATSAILAGGPLPSNLTAQYGTFGVYLRTQEQVNAGNTIVGPSNLLTSFQSVNGGNPGDPLSVLFDPATEHKFFIADANNVYATNNTGQTLSTLVLPAHFQNPTGLAYIADDTGNANNGVRALVVGGILDVGGSQGGIISTLDPFASSVQWKNLGPALPNVGVQDLNYYPSIDTLVAALYGRGAWILYDVTSYFQAATELWFGKANNNSAPDAARLTGNRPLEKFGTGTLTLTGAPTYSGGTIIDAGVVSITSDANLGAPQGGVTFNGGILQVNAPAASARSVTLNATGTLDTEADTTWSGIISGPGALDKIGPSTLTLTGSNTYLGGTFVLGGALAVGSDGALGDPSGQIGIDAATLKATASFATARTVAFGVDGGTVDTGAFTLTANGLWVAQGPVNKTGSGVLALEDLGWLQNVTVSAGTLQVDGSLTGTSLQVAPGAVLSGIGQIGAPTTISGTLAPGTPGPGVLTFTSPLTLASGSTLRIAVDGAATGGGPGSYSQVIVNGAGLTLGGTLSPFFRGIGGGANNNFTPAFGQQFTIAAATGGVTGQFAGVDLSGSGLPSFFRMDTLYGANAVNLVTTPASYGNGPAISGSIWSANQQSVGATLDALRPPAGTNASNTALQTAFNALYGLGASQIGPTLAGLSGQDEARGVANTLFTVGAFHVALQDHLIGGPLGSGFNNLSLALGGGGRGFSAAYNSLSSDGAAASGAKPSLLLEPSHAWGSVFYQASSNVSSAGIPGASTSISGFIAGIEGETRPGRLIGAAVATAHTDTSGPGTGSGDGFLAAAYGRQTTGPLQVAGYAGFARNTINLYHDFGFAGVSPADHPSGASSLLAGASIAYTVDLAGFQVIPTVTAAYTHMWFDGSNLLSPQGFNLNVTSQWVDSVRLTAGPTLTRSFKTDRGLRIVASLSAGYLHETGPVTLDAQLFGFPALAQSAPAGQDGAFAEVGLNALFSQSVTAFVRWRGEARAQFRSNLISGGMTATF
jgi:autotransporter-associated beta strand protein